MSKLIPEVCEAICLCSFSSAACESISPRQRFHLADKLITAREFNERVRPAHAVRSYYSDDEIHATCTVPRVRVLSEVYFGLNSTLF